MKFVYINEMEIEKLFLQSDFSSENDGLGTRIWNHLINYYKEANMPIDKTKLTKEMLEKAMKCQTADELIALFKKEGMEITKAEAEALFEKLQNEELDAGTLDKVAGGSFPPSIPMDDNTVSFRRRKF